MSNVINVHTLDFTTTLVAIETLTECFFTIVKMNVLDGHSNEGTLIPIKDGRAKE